MMQHRTRAILLLVCLFSVPGTESSSQTAVRRRGRKLEGYYEFDKDGSGNKKEEGNHNSFGGESNEGGGDGDGDGDSFGEQDSGYGGGSSSESYSSGSSSSSYGGGDSYGGGSDSYGSSDSYGGGSDSYGSSDSYGGGSDSYGGGSDSYGGGGDGGSDSYSGYGGDSSSSSYRPPSKASAFMTKMNVKVPLIPVLIISSVLLYFGMVLTAFMYQVHPESMFTNCCRLSINTSRTAYQIGFNLYHCRLGDIPPIVCAMDDEDDLDDEEIARMKPRAGIDRALEIEHKKTMDRAITETKAEASSTKLPGFAKVFG